MPANASTRTAAHRDHLLVIPRATPKLKQVARFTRGLSGGGGEHAHADHKSLHLEGQELPAHEAGAGRSNTIRGGAAAPVGAGSGDVAKQHKGGSAEVAVGPGEEERDRQVRGSFEGWQARVRGCQYQCPPSTTVKKRPH